MLFNLWKCKCLHIGRGNEGVHHTMGGTLLCNTVNDRD